MRGGAQIVAVAVLMVMSVQVQAQTLADALIEAYQSNPQLLSQRQALRATDEGVSQALSGWRPTISIAATGGPNFQDSRTTNRITGQQSELSDTLISRTASGTLSQPIFEGFRTVKQTAAAEALVKAGRARLESTEQLVLLQAVTAFMDVIRDQATLELQTHNEEVLRRQLEATNDRFRVGEVTRTDVAQAESRVARSVADRISAGGVLISSRAGYQRVIGTAPGTLKVPDTPIVPNTEAEAIGLALNNNPDIRQAEFAEEAARNDVDVAFATLLPTLSLNVQRSYSEDTTTAGGRILSTAVTGRVSVPLYQSGAEYSQVRQRKEIASQRRIDIDDVKRQVRQAAINSFQTYTTATAALEAQREQVKAAEVAFEGASQEAEVGARTVLDVLDNEQELLNARVRVVQLERDRLVAAHTLLQAIGQLTAPSLGLPTAIYDPAKHYNDVRWQFIGTNPWGEEK